MGLILPNDALRYSLVLMETSGRNVESFINYYDAVPIRHPPQSQNQHRLRIYFTRAVFDQQKTNF